eukprot:TRINITY_DN49052_c0_g1_i2.p1 TRINITY_DN49052_c0_g1~~TRINITY_DN49052_c0_g1_i2.p1  ORF type:complete len:489 (-),score=126.64 TRINITY_DN49052_c0_g1_i2:82-1548(-)
MTAASAEVEGGMSETLQQTLPAKSVLVLSNSKGGGCLNASMTVGERSLAGTSALVPGQLESTGFLGASLNGTSAFVDVSAEHVHRDQPSAQVAPSPTLQETVHAGDQAAAAPRTAAINGQSTAASGRCTGAAVPALSLPRVEEFYDDDEDEEDAILKESSAKLSASATLLSQLSLTSSSAAGTGPLKRSVGIANRQPLDASLTLGSIWGHTGLNDSLLYSGTLGDTIGSQQGLEATLALSETGEATAADMDALVVGGSAAAARSGSGSGGRGRQRSRSPGAGQLPGLPVVPRSQGATPRTLSPATVAGSSLGSSAGRKLLEKDLRGALDKESQGESPVPSRPATGDRSRRSRSGSGAGSCNLEDSNASLSALMARAFEGANSSLGSSAAGLLRECLVDQAAASPLSQGTLRPEALSAKEPGGLAMSPSSAQDEGAASPTPTEQTTYRPEQLEAFAKAVEGAEGLDRELQAELLGLLRQMPGTSPTSSK